MFIRKAADEISDTISSSNPTKRNKINELVVTSNKLTNIFTSLIIIYLRPDVAREPPVDDAGLENPM